jgi:Tol biopolymer transport system component
LISPTAGPAWSPDGGELAFATQPKGTPLPSGDVDVVPTTTGTTVAPHPLVTHLLDGATSLSWAPGHALLFTSGHEPGIVQADMSGWPTDPGSFAGHLVASCGTCVDFGPSWAPDGLHFSFVRNGRVAIATPDRGVEAIIGPRPVSFAQWGGGAA